MPPEKTVPLALSGSEIKTAILDKISNALNQDCYLHDASAYDWFDGKITVELRLSDLGRDEQLKVLAVASEGEKPAEEPENVKVEIKVDAEPPNQVRIETGQPVPTATGQRIKYARKAAEKRNG